MSRGKVAIFTNQPANSRYLVKLLENVAQIEAHLEPGTVTVLHAYHDEGCSLLAGTGPCDCDPTLQVKREEP